MIERYKQLGKIENGNVKCVEDTTRPDKKIPAKANNELK